MKSRHNKITIGSLQQNKFITLQQKKINIAIQFLQQNKVMTLQHRKIQISSETQREEVSANAAQRWAIGLIDGDGSIGIEWANKQKTKWVPFLNLSLHSSNARALYKLKKILGVATINKPDAKNMITFRVRRRDHWENNLLALFEKFNLRTVKQDQVTKLKSAFAIENDQTLTRAMQLQKVQQLFCFAKKFSTSDNTAISPVWPSANVQDYADHVLKTCLDYDWLAGFVEAEGSFYILKKWSTWVCSWAKTGSAYN